MALRIRDSANRLSKLAPTSFSARSLVCLFVCVAVHTQVFILPSGREIIESSHINERANKSR